MGHHNNSQQKIIFRYKKWKLGNDIELVARCEHDAVMPGPSGEMQFMNVKTLNEWDPRVCRLKQMPFDPVFFKEHKKLQDLPTITCNQIFP